MWGSGSDGNFNKVEKARSSQRGTQNLALRTVVTIWESGLHAAARAPNFGGGTSKIDFYMNSLKF